MSNREYGFYWVQKFSDKIKYDEKIVVAEWRCVNDKNYWFFGKDAFEEEEVIALSEKLSLSDQENHLDADQMHYLISRLQLVYGELHNASNNITKIHAEKALILCEVMDEIVVRLRELEEYTDIPFKKNLHSVEVSMKDGLAIFCEIIDANIPDNCIRVRVPKGKTFIAKYALGCWKEV